MILYPLYANILKNDKTEMNNKNLKDHFYQQKSYVWEKSLSWSTIK